MGRRIDIIATTISGSIRDWSKVDKILPLFHEYGEDNVSLSVVNSHQDARKKACELIQAKSRILISAGGSGTFNSVLEGCFDSGESLDDLMLGFLRKGSADLLGKVLGMPDQVEAAVKVFVKSIRTRRMVPCDILVARSESGDAPIRHFVGYGGAEIFGEIPRYTENRFIKYYKGILSQLFGDLGPFFVGASLAIIGRLVRRIRRGRRRWQIWVDGDIVSEGFYQAMVIVNGDLGPDLPFARNAPLGSGEFHIFVIRDRGALKLLRQFKHAWDGSILDNPERWGFEAFRVRQQLRISPDTDDPFPLNVDGSALPCRKAARIEIHGHINLLSR